MTETEEIQGQVKGFVEGLLRQAGLDLECRCESQEGVITVNLEGEDAGLVLRENARLLYSINHLINQAFYRRNEGRFNFLVDCEDYRATRVMELQLLARKAAEKARSSRKPFKLQAMPSSERRIIHLALAEEEGVGTTSEGNGAHRRVVILPSR